MDGGTSFGSQKTSAELLNRSTNVDHTRMKEMCGLVSRVVVDYIRRRVFRTYNQF